MRTIRESKNADPEDFTWWRYAPWVAYVSNMTVANKTGFAPWSIRRASPVIDLPHLLSNIDEAVERQQFHHRDYYDYLDAQRTLLKHVRKTARKNQKDYIGKRNSKFWKHLNKTQRRQIKKKQIKIRSKVLVKDISKSGISPNKLVSKKRGPYTVIGRAVNNNAYKVRDDRTGYTDYVNLRRIRLIVPSPAIIADEDEVEEHSNDNDDVARD